MATREPHPQRCEQATCRYKVEIMAWDLRVWVATGYRAAETTTQANDKASSVLSAADPRG